MKEKIERTIKFYVLATSLKDKLRSGWCKWHISKERIESIAEHIYGTCILAIAVDSEFDEDIDLSRVLKMLVLHELEEIIIGDITPFDNVSKEEKLKIGKKAVQEVLDGLIKSEEYNKLLDEFNEHLTNESRFAYCCDKLEADLQAKIYEEKGCSNIFADVNKKMVNESWIKKMLNNGASNLADLFIEYDRKNYTESFNAIAQYIKTNDITNKMN